MGPSPLDGDLARGISDPDARGDLPPLPVKRPKVAKGAKGAALNGPARTLVRIPHPENAAGAKARPGELALVGGGAVIIIIVLSLRCCCCSLVPLACRSPPAARVEINGKERNSGDDRGDSCCCCLLQGER